MRDFHLKDGRQLIYLTLFICILAACSNGNHQSMTQSEINGNPTPRDFLEQANADIFVLGGIVYSNVANVQWVQELDYSMGEQTAEITEQTEDAGGFTNGSANKLPVGTKIYETDKAVYIAVVGNKEIPYLPMIEG